MGLTVLKRLPFFFIGIDVLEWDFRFLMGPSLSWWDLNFFNEFYIFFYETWIILMGLTLFFIVPDPIV